MELRDFRACKQECSGSEDIAGAGSIRAGSGAHGLNAAEPAILIDVRYKSAPATVDYWAIVCAIEDAVNDAKATEPTNAPGPGMTLSRFAKYRLDKKRNEWRTNRDEARTWLLDEQDHEGRRVFSFDWCCIALGWDSLKIRERLSVMLAEAPSTLTVEAA